MPVKQIPTINVVEFMFDTVDDVTIRFGDEKDEADIPFYGRHVFKRHSKVWRDGNRVVLDGVPKRPLVCGLESVDCGALQIPLC